jgi:hypothetical protein
MIRQANTCAWAGGWWWWWWWGNQRPGWLPPRGWMAAAQGLAGCRPGRCTPPAAHARRGRGRGWLLRGARLLPGAAASAHVELRSAAVHDHPVVVRPAGAALGVGLDLRRRAGFMWMRNGRPSFLRPRAPVRLSPKHQLTPTLAPPCTSQSTNRQARRPRAPSPRLYIVDV